jgi:hypothetical protein
VIHLSKLELLQDFLINRALPGVLMRRIKRQFICLMLLAMMLPATAAAISLDEAAKQAARQNNAKVLSARTVENGNSRIHEIKLLTKDGVVKTVRIPDNSKKKKR